MERGPSDSKSTDNRQLTTDNRQWWSPVRPWVPVAFFFGGFAWDAVTLGRRITSLDLLIVLAYLTGAAAILLVIGRGPTFRGAAYLNSVLQFFFGGTFSALLVFYFLSSSTLPAYAVVVLLGALLIGNEFLESAYSELTPSWSFFTLSAMMFFNFALAHLFRSISTFWFYAGTLIAVACVALLRRFSRAESASIKPALGVAALMLLLHAFNLIPPVPLVKKEMFVAHSVRRAGGQYVAEVEPPGWRVWRRSSTGFRKPAGGRIYCFTSVFIPAGIETTIRHRWLKENAEGEWVTTSVIPIRITGGREGGYRGYSYKQNVTAGAWRVIAEAESGAAIAIVDFDVTYGDPGELRTLRL
jgi:hypothetical protein